MWLEQAEGREHNVRQMACRLCARHVRRHKDKHTEREEEPMDLKFSVAWPSSRFLTFKKLLRHTTGVAGEVTNQRCLF